MKTENGMIKIRGRAPISKEKFLAEAKAAVDAIMAEKNIPRDVAEADLILSGWNRKVALHNNRVGETDKRRGAPGRKAKAAAK